jgi:hypothetical protein
MNAMQGYLRLQVRKLWTMGSKIRQGYHESDTIWKLATNMYQKHMHLPTYFQAMNQMSLFRCLVS